MTVAEMLQRMTSRELTEWQVYSNLEPWGEEREDLRSGMATSPLLNIQMGKKGKKSKPSDWIMDFVDAPEEQTDEDMKLILQGFVARRKADRERAERVKGTGK